MGNPKIHSPCSCLEPPDLLRGNSLPLRFVPALPPSPIAPGTEMFFLARHPPYPQPSSSLPTLRPIISSSSSWAPRAGRLAPASVPLSGGLRARGGGRAGRDWRVLLPAGEALQGTGVRGFGVMDSVQDKIINRNLAKQGVNDSNGKNSRPLSKSVVFLHRHDALAVLPLFFL